MQPVVDVFHAAQRPQLFQREDPHLGHVFFLLHLLLLLRLRI